MRNAINLVSSLAGCGDASLEWQLFDHGTARRGRLVAALKTSQAAAAAANSGRQWRV